MWKASILASAAAIFLVVAAQAQDTAEPDRVVARVNGAEITEADVASARAEVGGELSQIPEQHHRRVLVEYLIETQLLADAATGEKLDQGRKLEDRMRYYRRRALRDIFFEDSVRGGVTEADAKSFYDEQVQKIPTQVEVRARHILVETQEEASDIRERLARGEDFAKLANEHSKDPGSQDGDLGYFSKDQMVEPFAEVAFSLQPGDLSEPVETQFGWHVIKVEDRRERKPPAFEQVREQIVNALVQERTRTVIQDLRRRGDIEMVDPALKEPLPGQQPAPEAQPSPDEAPKQ